MRDFVRINEQIRASELRIIGPNGENLGVLPFGDGLKRAKESKLDLIEIAPIANPPVAKIMDYGKYLYEEKKKKRAATAKTHMTETKNVQVKIGTGEHDLNLKASRAGEWLREGHRVKIDLFLPGRTKYMERGFLEERLDRVLKLITEPFKIADSAKKSPKGLTVFIEKDPSKKPNTNDTTLKEDAQTALSS